MRHSQSQITGGVKSAKGLPATAEPHSMQAAGPKSPQKLRRQCPALWTSFRIELIYCEKSALPQALSNRLIRLAAFQDPE